MEELIKMIESDEEIQQMRKQWEKSKQGPFPPFNTDEYANIPDYKEKVRAELNED